MKKWITTALYALSLCLITVACSTNEEPTDVPNPSVTARILGKSLRTVSSSSRLFESQERLEGLIASSERFAYDYGPDQSAPEAVENPFAEILEDLSEFIENFEEVVEHPDGSQTKSVYTQNEGGGFTLVETTLNAEGDLIAMSTTIFSINEDGNQELSSVETNANGEEIFKESVVFFSDGSIFVSYQDHEEETEGSITFHSDGSVTYHETSKDGIVTEGIIQSNGTGTYKTTYPDGSVQDGTFDEKGDNFFDLEDDDLSGMGTFFEDGTGSATFTTLDGDIIEESYDKEGVVTSKTVFQNGDISNATYHPYGSFTETLTLREGDIERIISTGTYREENSQEIETIEETLIYRDGQQETIHTELILTDDRETGTRTFSDGSVETFQSVDREDGSVLSSGSWTTVDGSESSTYEEITHPDGTTDLTENFISEEGQFELQLKLVADGSGEGTLTFEGQQFVLQVNADGTGTMTAPDGTVEPF